MKAAQTAAAVLIVAVWLAAATPPAAAHGGGTAQLIDSPVGPYRLYVWSKPDPVRVGEAHLTIGVFQPPAGDQTDVPVLDASVLVELAPLGHPAEPTSDAATRENAANKLYYELDIKFPAAGDWRITISVTGPAGSGSASFDLQVLPPTLNWALIGGGAAVALAAGWWLLNARSGRQPE